MNRLSVLLIAVLARGLTACAASDIVISGDGPSGLPYDPSYVRYVMGEGDLPLEIHGNPSALDDAAFAELVETTLQIDPFFGTTAFRRDAQMRNRHGFRLVLMFNADNPRIDAGQVCAGEDLDKAGGANTTLFVRGVFCSRDTVLSEDSALAPAPDDFAGPRFRRVLDLLVTSLLPPEGRRDLNVTCPTANCS